MIKPTILQSCLPANKLVAPYECDLGNAKLVDLMNQLNLTLIKKEDVTLWANQINGAICPLGVCQSDLKGLTIKSDQPQDFTLSSNKATSNGNIVFPGNIIIDSWKSFKFRFN